MKKLSALEKLAIRINWACMGNILDVKLVASEVVITPQRVYQLVSGIKGLAGVEEQEPKLRGIFEREFRSTVTDRDWIFVKIQAFAQARQWRHRIMNDIVAQEVERTAAAEAQKEAADVAA